MSGALAVRAARESGCVCHDAREEIRKRAEFIANAYEAGKDEAAALQVLATLIVAEQLQEIRALLDEIA